MTKIFKQGTTVYLALLLLLIGFTKVFTSLGYQFVLTNQIPWFIFHFAVTALGLFLCLYKRKEVSRVSRALSQLLPLVALWYVVCVTLFPENGGHAATFVLIICFFLSCYGVYLLYATASVWEKNLFFFIMFVVNFFILILFAILLFLFFIFGELGKDTVVKEVTSPNKAYTAMVIDSSQGAMGGDTFVEVKENTSQIDFSFGQFIKEKLLYSGAWLEQLSIEVKWKNDETLLIDELPHEMSKYFEN